jgi:hypothetical protein
VESQVRTLPVELTYLSRTPLPRDQGGCFLGHYSVQSLIDGIVTPGDLDQMGDRVAERFQDLSCQEHVGAHHRMSHGVMLRRHLLCCNRAKQATRSDQREMAQFPLGKADLQ